MDGWDSAPTHSWISPYRPPIGGLFLFSGRIARIQAQPRKNPALRSAYAAGFYGWRFIAQNVEKYNASLIAPPADKKNRSPSSNFTTANQGRFR
jgi:hypothetical protein